MCHDILRMFCLFSLSDKTNTWVVHWSFWSITILYVTSYVDGSFFFGTMIVRYVKLDVEGDMMPALSKWMNSFLSQTLCLNDNVYDFCVMVWFFSLGIRIILLNLIANVRGVFEKMSLYSSHGLCTCLLFGI